MIVVDADTLMLFFHGDEAVRSRLLATPPEEVAIPAVVAFEVFAALRRADASARRRAQLRRLLDGVRTPWLGLAEADVAASLEVELEQAGHALGPLDVMLAATALCYGATLVTPRPAVFAPVPGLETVDWTSDAVVEVGS